MLIISSTRPYNPELEWPVYVCAYCMYKGMFSIPLEQQHRLSNKLNKWEVVEMPLPHMNRV